MSQVWVTSTDGDLLRADQIRQLNTVEGVRAVLVGGSQFVLAEISGRKECTALARELTAAIATAEARDQWAEICLVRGGPGWTVEVASTPASTPRPTPILTPAPAPAPTPTPESDVPGREKP